MAFHPSPKSLLLALGALCFLSQLHFTLAALYKVADMNGKWGVENYFQAGDSLSFSHHTDTGEVHEVSWNEYKACHTRNPMKTYKKGDNVAEFGGKSTYYFISGDKALCKSGRKLMVVILATSPAPAASPPVTVAAPPPTATAPTPPPAATPPPSSPPPASPPPPAATPPPSSPPPPAATPPPATSPPSATPPATPPPATPSPATPTTTPTSAPAPTTATPASSPTPSTASSPSPTAPASTASPPTPPSAPAPTPPPSTPPSAAPSLPILLTWSIMAIALSTSLILLA